MMTLSVRPAIAVPRTDLTLCTLQISNATTVHVRRPGNPKKWKARVACDGRICDLALLTVDDDGFWEDDLQPLQFVDVPELQVGCALLRIPAQGPDSVKA